MFRFLGQNCFIQFQKLKFLITQSAINRSKFFKMSPSFFGELYYPSYQPVQFSSFFSLKSFRTNKNFWFSNSRKFPFFRVFFGWTNFFFWFYQKCLQLKYYLSSIHYENNFLDLKIVPLLKYKKNLSIIIVNK